MDSRYHPYGHLIDAYLTGLSSVLSDPGSSDQRVDSGVNLLPSTLSDDGAP